MNEWSFTARRQQWSFWAHLRVMQCIMIKLKYYESFKIESCENTKTTVKSKYLKNKNCQKNLKLYLFIEMYLFQTRAAKLSQDTPVLPQVVKLGHAPDKIQV